MFAAAFIKEIGIAILRHSLLIANSLLLNTIMKNTRAAAHDTVDSMPAEKLL
jgi:hypothetical protein